jgi:hypothetical protein
MKTVWKTMHENNGRFFARILSGVNAVLIPPYRPLHEVHLFRRVIPFYFVQSGCRISRTTDLFS